MPSISWRFCNASSASVSLWWDSTSAAEVSPSSSEEMQQTLSSMSWWSWWCFGIAGFYIYVLKLKRYTSLTSVLAGWPCFFEYMDRGNSNTNWWGMWMWMYTPWAPCSTVKLDKHFVIDRAMSQDPKKLNHPYSSRCWHLSVSPLQRLLPYPVPESGRTLALGNGVACPGAEIPQLLA